MFITTDDLFTHLRNENTELITRGDETITQAAIDGAMAEAKGYLGDYDTEAIFSAEAEKRNALLLIFVKDIAVWHLINLSNNSTAYDKRESRYNRAIEWLKSVQRGLVTPDLPHKVDEQGNTTSPFLSVYNPKREQRF